jgi:hypothetical protein
MSRRCIFGMIAMPLIALSVQNPASAQEMANYQRNHSVSRLKENVPSGLNRFTRGQLSNVFGQAAGGAHSRTASEHAERK